jgi:hypothetical protein
VPGQRYCRNCGANLGVILDAMEGKQRGPLDFDQLKRDLRELGANLRSGFEEAGVIKRTQRLNQTATPNATAPQMIQTPNWSREFNKALKKVKAANSRKYSFQQAALSLFGGGAMIAVWYHLLNIAADSGLLSNIETIILQQTGTHVVGLAEVLQQLWLLGLIPIARGVGHLFNGIFFAPKKIEESEEQINPAPIAYYPSPAPSIAAPHVATNELDKATAIKSQPSVTEDETLRFEPR